MANRNDSLLTPEYFLPAGIAFALSVVLGVVLWLYSDAPSTSGSLATANPQQQGEIIASKPNFPSSDQPVVVRGQSDTTEARLKFDGNRSYEYLKSICALGNRMSGSSGMKQQQEMLEQHFQQLGGQVSFQRFTYKNPLNGKRVPMANMIVQWRPEAEQRILLCAHYDTRPLPDRDPNPRLRTKGEFLGANDGASGVALLMELGNHVPTLPLNHGLDFVLFDGEELVYFDGRDDIGKYFAGSTWFARQYAQHPPKYNYVAGVLFDMVGDADLTLYQEQNSSQWPETRPIVKEIWGTAERLGIEEFIPRVRYLVNDDHVPLYYIAKIPVCDVIDFWYPDDNRRYWHTTADAPGRCSGESLGKVGSVIMEWLTTTKR